MDKVQKTIQKWDDRAAAIARNNKIEFNERFNSLGAFAQAATFATIAGDNDPANRLSDFYAAAGSAGVGADGGFAVPPVFAQEIREKVKSTSLLGLVDFTETEGNSLISITDADEPWNQDKGIKCGWNVEGGELTASVPRLESHENRLGKLSCLVPVTRELVEDAASLDGYLRHKVAEKMGAAITDAILNGNGVGKPLGILKSPCLVSVAKETSQVADTILAENLLKMWSRCYGPGRSQAVWLCNQDIEPQVMAASIKIKNVAGTENVGGFSVYNPAAGLFGRPIIPTEACATLGDLGDIVLADLSEFHLVGAKAGMSVVVSTDKWFDRDLVVYKFIWRLQGQPWPSSTITPKYGTESLSPFVALAERA